MLFQRKKVASALAYALGTGGAVLGTAAAVAQDIRVEVTGSSIRRVEAEGALPVQIFNRADIERSGAANMQELIQSIPVMQGFTTQGDSVGGGGAGFTGAGLRGQGETRTLVLLNGKRLAPSGTQALTGAQAAVNLNNIPIVAIDRVEVLLDGASALYGADAIGGVVNFITRRDVSYGEIAGGYWSPDGGDGTEYNVSAVKGFGTLEKEGWNVLFGASYDDRKPLKAPDRRYAKSGVYRFTEGSQEYEFRLGSQSPIPANLVSGDNFFTPYLAENGTCAPQTFVVDGLCNYDFTPNLEIYPEQNRTNAFASFTTKLGQNHQFSLDYIYSKSETTSRLAPPPGSFNILDTSPLWPQVVTAHTAAGLPLPPGDEGVIAAYRVADVGKRTTEDVSTANHVSAEFKGLIGKGWEYAASYTHSESEYKSNLRGGWVLNSAFRRALNSGLVDPFVGPGQQSAEGQALLNESILNGFFDGGTTKLDLVDGRVTGGIFDMSGGQAQLALGAQWMKEKFNAEPSQLAQGFGPDGQPDTRFGDTSAIIPYSADRDVWAVYTELLLPITNTFEFTASLRYDDYEDFGNTTNYKLAARWQPVRQVLLRGSYGTGFKAPTVPQLNAAQQPFGVTGGTYGCRASDPQGPALASIAASLGVNCPRAGAATQWDQLAGGNPLLQPEESEQWTVGVRWEPTPELSLGADYWEIRVDNAIGQIDEDTVFGNPLNYTQSFAPYVDPTTGEPLIAYLGSNLNLGKEKTKGIDFDFSYRKATDIGLLRSQLLATYIIKHDFEVVPGEGYLSDLGAFVNGSVTFRWKARWANTLDVGNWQHTFALNYLSGYHDDPTPVFPVDANGVAADSSVVLARKVDDYFTADWQSRWQFAKNWTWTLGVKNLANASPPLSITQNGGGQMVGYDARFYDSRDRTFYSTLAFRF